MIPLSCLYTAPLRLEDFSFLEPVFANEIEWLLPFPASVDMLVPGQEGEADVSGLEAVCRSGAPATADGVLVIPLQLEDDQVAAVCIRDVDPQLLKKLGREWLQTLQRDVAARLRQGKLIFTDPQTGLYNCRAFHLLFQEKRHRAACSLYGIRARFSCRTAAACRQRLMTTAYFLQALTGGVLFYLGQDTFVFLDADAEPAAMNETARRILRAFRREGASRVHIGYGRFGGMDTGGTPDQEQLWQALARAEQRGPFGSCDIRTLESSDLFPLPPARELARLRRQWRGLDRFGLVLLVLDDPAGWQGDLQAAVSEALPSRAVACSGDGNEAFVLLPGMDSRNSLETAGTLCRRFAAAHPGHTLSAGVSCWPMLSFSRTETLRNCRKAILHAAFLGSGSTVLFDHLSLNISGDRFFDDEEYLKAAREYRLGLRLAPEDINLLNSLGVVLAEMNDHRRAIDCFSRVIELEPENFMAWFNRGLSLLARGRERQALDAFVRAHRIGGDRSRNTYDLCLQLGQLYCRHHRYDQAMEVLEPWKEDRQRQHDFLLHRLLGEAYMGTGRGREAMQALERSLRLYPRDGDSLSMLGLLYLREGQGEEVGLSLCRRAVRLDTSSPDYAGRLAEGLLLLGRPEEAETVLQEVVGGFRRHPGASLLYGRIQEQLGRIARAERIFRRVAGMKAATEMQKDLAGRLLEGLQAGTGREPERMEAPS